MTRKSNLQHFEKMLNRFSNRFWRKLYIYHIVNSKYIRKWGCEYFQSLLSCLFLSCGRHHVTLCDCCTEWKRIV